MIFKFIIDILQVVLLVAGFTILIKSFIMRRKVKRLSKFLEKEATDWRERVNKIDERLNLLSRENVKLRTENEMLKERLRNLGINDFDVVKL